jgi:hypothetical protein
LRVKSRTSGARFTIKEATWEEFEKSTPTPRREKPRALREAGKIKLVTEPL